jgi:hypothetical protein
MRWVEHAARMGDVRDARTVLVEKPNRKTLTRLRRRWVDNIKMDIQQVGPGSIDWIGLAEDRNRWRALVNEVMNLRFPLKKRERERERGQFLN